MFILGMRDSDLFVVDEIEQMCYTEVIYTDHIVACRCFVTSVFLGELWSAGFVPFVWGK